MFGERGARRLRVGTALNDKHEQVFGAPHCKWSRIKPPRQNILSFADVVEKTEVTGDVVKP